MTARVEPSQVAPAAMAAMRALTAFVHGCGLDEQLLELLMVRASQMNGCAFCIDMHGRAAMASGDDPMRLLILNAWRETRLFDPRERAALALTEALTLLAADSVPDDIYEEARRHFNDQEVVNLAVAIGLINSWNRIMVLFRVPPRQSRSTLDSGGARPPSASLGSGR